MKLATLLLVPTLGICLAATAQMGEQPPMGNPGQMGGRGGMGRRGGPRMGGPQGGQGKQDRLPNPDKQTKKLAKQLKLNDEQKAQVRSILQDQQNQIQQAMNDSTLSRQDRMSKLQEIHGAASDKINALLNDTQKAKYAQILQKQQERRSERRGQMSPGGYPQ